MNTATVKGAADSHKTFTRSSTIKSPNLKTAAKVRQIIFDCQKPTYTRWPHKLRNCPNRNAPSQSMVQIGQAGGKGHRSMRSLQRS